MPKPGGALVTAVIAADRLGLCRVTIIRWIRRKPPTIRGIRIAGRWYVYRADLEKILASQLQVQT